MIVPAERLLFLFCFFASSFASLLPWLVSSGTVGRSSGTSNRIADAAAGICTGCVPGFRQSIAASKGASVATPFNGAPRPTRR
jgi:hypothetical protein